MSDQYIRTRLLLGSEAVEKLKKSRVAVFGIGGVGGYVCEALIRSGVGAFDLVDNDTVSLSNLNRQIIATRKTVGKYKTEVMRERMLDIAPDTDIRIHTKFFLPENAAEFPFEEYDYIIDAVDTVTAKLCIITTAVQKGVPVISSMGTGNKLDPSRFRVSDISKTTICPLARIMRKELRQRGIKKLKVVWSDEEPLAPDPTAAEEYREELAAAAAVGRRAIPGSTAFVPASAGLLLAAEVIKDLTHM